MNLVIMWATVVVAAANVALAIITFFYLRATSKLVRLQREPNLEVGFAGPLQGEPKIVIRNAGADPIINIRVFERHCLFREPDKPPIMWNAGPIPGPDADRSAFWRIDKLTADERQEKSMEEPLKIHWRNHRSHTVMISKAESIDPAKVSLTSLLFVDVNYQREIDKKTYQVTRIAFIIEVDSKPTLFEPIFSFSSLKRARTQQQCLWSRGQAGNLLSDRCLEGIAGTGRPSWSRPNSSAATGSPEQLHTNSKTVALQLSPCVL